MAAPADGSLAEQVIGFVPYRGRRVALAVSGSGPPLLLDVGHAHDLGVFWSYPPYRQLVRRLSRRFTVVRWDRLGWGLSDRVRQDVSARAEVELVERLATFLGIGRMAVVAAGDAGPTMVRFAARRPERVSRLALFGTAVGAPTLLPEAEPARALLAGSSAPAIHVVLATAHAAGCDADLVEWLTSALRSAADVATMVELVAAPVDRGAVVDAGAVRTPTLVLHRSDDPVVDVAWGRALASRIPGAAFRRLTGPCHLLYAGDIDAVLAELMPFLSGDTPDWQPLSRRELEVARSVTLGLPNLEIADQLGICRRTVEAHLEHIRAKLSVGSRAQIASWYARQIGES